VSLDTKVVTEINQLEDKGKNTNKAAVFFVSSNLFFCAAFVFNFSFAPFSIFSFTPRVSRNSHYANKEYLDASGSMQRKPETFPLACNSRVQNLAADSDALERNIKAN
jgi:hypothetical protein